MPNGQKMLQNIMAFSMLNSKVLNTQYFVPSLINEGCPQADNKTTSPQDGARAGIIL